MFGRGTLEFRTGDYALVQQTLHPIVPAAQPRCASSAASCACSNAYRPRQGHLRGPSTGIERDALDGPPDGAHRDTLTAATVPIAVNVAGHPPRAPRSSSPLPAVA
jgi:hypothetical protein